MAKDMPADSNLPARIYRAMNMFNAARVVGDALREVFRELPNPNW
jgi:hypothetical protein